MIGQFLSVVWIFVISYLVIGSNFPVITSDVLSDKTDEIHGNGKDQDHFTSSKSRIRKRNTFEEFRNLEFYHESSTRESTSKIWFQFATPTPSYPQTSTQNRYKDEEQIQGPHEVHEDAQFVYDTIKNPSSKLLDSSGGSFTINHVGCFSTWEKQYTQLTQPDVLYDETQLHITCASKCRQKGELMQISFLKGAECQCSPIYQFQSVLKRDSYCNIPCPLKDFTISPDSTHELGSTCGGNEGYSVYCSSGPGKCNEVLQDAENQRRAIERQQSNSAVQSEKRRRPVPVLEQLCTKCEHFSDTENFCVQPYLLPDFDYFPVNSPDDCVRYCGSKVSYVMIGQQERERPPTEYALLLWWKTNGKDLPMCRCANDSIRRLFHDLEDSSACNMPCPGKNDTICGGKQQGSLVFATVYCIDYTGDGKCRPYSSTTTTTTNSPSHETEDPCSNPFDEYIDCDDPIGVTWTDEGLESTRTTTEPEPTSNTEEETTGTEISTELPSTSSDIPDTTATTTSLPTSSTTTTTMGSTNMTTTTSPPTTTNATTAPSTITTPPVQSSTPCNVKCEAFDRHSYYWEVCAGNEAIVRCEDLNQRFNVTGLAFWRCSTDGNFETAHPNVSNCTSVWLEEKQDEIEKITDIGGADTFVDKLAEACKNAARPNSSSHYFGHEIRDIALLVGLTVLKAREFLNDSSGPTFTDLQNVVDKAVDLNVFLIQYYEPWKDLPLPERSVISSDIIDNTEEALFNLTYEAHDREYMRIFQLNNSEANKFLILADTFNKWTSNLYNKSYEFPPKTVRNEHDSFIKLPGGWGKLVGKQIEIAAMSIDSEFISTIMPGQYDNLVSSSTFDENDVNPKLMNGRLISFTLMSTEADQTDTSSILKRPTISFTGKGVEITFHHDIEAWGNDIQNVPRNLHDGELPKAVLGSSECVFWDTKTLSWSSKGCKIVRANRYETVCECNHLTSFAILMDIHRYVGKEFGLELLTLILCPASEVALVVSIIILSSVSGLQRIRATITKNLSACLLVGNALVLFVLDRNYFNMNEGVCVGAAMITHYVFLCAFMWMLIEGIQLYRMVVHVFDSGRSYIKYFGLFAYGIPLLVIAITATTGYLNGDKPYGGDVYCWLEGPYVWSFMGPVAIVTTVNFIILFIALKTAYQVQKSKKHTPIFIMGKLRSYKTWFKGCFSLTVILGLTWVVGFFTLMKSPGGIIAAYIFTILNASQGLFIFFFNCVLNEKVRSFTQRNLSTYLPSWLSSSISSNPDPGGNDGSVYGKRPLSLKKSGESVTKKRTSARRQISSPIPIPIDTKTRAKIYTEKIDEEMPDSLSPRKFPRSTKVDFVEARNTFISDTPVVQRCESIGTISSVDSLPNSAASETGHISSDNSQNVLISKVRF